MAAFNLLYRVLNKNQPDEDDGFKPSEDLKIHEGKTINLVIGMAASAKTSMIQISAGGEETSVRTRSETQDPVLVLDEVNDKLWLDTAGMCDSSAAPDHKASLRDAIVDAIKQHKLRVGRIFICVACDQNMNVDFAREWPEFRGAFPRAHDELVRVVITKVNRRKKARQVQEPGGIKEKYASAFGCSDSRVLLHGHEPFDRDVLLHAVDPAIVEGIGHDDIGAVVDSEKMMESILGLEDELDRLSLSKNEHLSDKEQAEKRISELDDTIKGAEAAIDDLEKKVWCPAKEIRAARDVIARAEDNIQETRRKLLTNEILAVEVSCSCNEILADIIRTRAELEGRVRLGLKLSSLAGATESFLRAFDYKKEGRSVAKKADTS